MELQKKIEEYTIEDLRELVKTLMTPYIRSWQEIEARLSEVPDKLEIRELARAGKTFKYLPAMTVTRELNAIFGIGNWTTRLNEDRVRETEDKSLVFTKYITLSVEGLGHDGTRIGRDIDGVGVQIAYSNKKTTYYNAATGEVGGNIPQDQKRMRVEFYGPVPEQVELAEKASYWDGVKNAAARMGNRLGMILYLDDEQIANSIQDDIDISAYSKGAATGMVTEGTPQGKGTSEHTSEPGADEGPTVPTKVKHRESYHIPDKLTCEQYMQLVPDEAPDYLNWMATREKEPRKDVFDWLERHKKPIVTSAAGAAASTTVRPGKLATDVLTKLIEGMADEDTASPQISKEMRAQLGKLGYEQPNHLNNLVAQITSNDFKSIDAIRKAAAKAITTYIYALAEKMDKDEYKAFCAFSYETALPVKVILERYKDDAIAIMQMAKANKTSYREARATFQELPGAEPAVEAPAPSYTYVKDEKNTLILALMACGWKSGYEDKYVDEVATLCKAKSIPIDASDPVFRAIAEGYARKMA